MPEQRDMATLPIGTRVLIEFGTGAPGCWTEYGTVTGYVKKRLVIALDETAELPDWLGGGWCCEVERERDEVDVVEWACGRETER